MFINFNLLSAALLTGLIGSIHCVGMCGGIVGALTLGAPQTSPTILLTYTLLYNLGRLSSYLLAGLIVGFLGTQIMQPLPDLYQAHLWLSGLFMISLGLYLSAWWPILIKLEKLGSYLWRWLAPLGQNYLPLRKPTHAFGLGLIWGWLPCGLVYTALALAFAAGNTLQGGLIMLVFGIGTLPMLFTMSGALHKIVHLTRHRYARSLAGVLIIGLGVYTLLTPLASLQHRLFGIDLCYF